MKNKYKQVENAIIINYDTLNMYFMIDVESNSYHLSFIECLMCDMGGEVFKPYDNLDTLNLFRAQEIHEWYMKHHKKECNE